MRWFVWMCIAVIGIIAGVAHADKAEDTAVLVEKAVIMFKEQGSAATIKAINDPQGLS